MNSNRKRNLPITPSTSPLKKPKDDPDSDDSFENFVINVSPRSRSGKIELEDSFDKPITQKVEIKKKESGIPGFPWIGIDNRVRLEVVKSENIEGTLHVECKNGSIVYLQDQWSETKIEGGDILNLIDPKKWAEDDYIIDSEQGVLIVNPDVLVPCTSTASSTWCSRKQILNDRFKFGNSSNKAMLLGTIIHEIFQSALMIKKRPIKEEDLLEIWKKESKNYIQELIALSFTPNCFNAEIQPYLPIICDWINKKLPKASFFEKPSPLPSKSIISEVHDIEDNIWEPLLGMKGKVDVTIRTKSGTMESIELKTGKSSGSTEHMAQVLMYSMMLSSKYDQKIGFGNLLYLKDGESRSVSPRAQELIAIIQQRNGLAKYLENSFQNLLPEPRSESRFCDKCDHKMMCSFYQKNEEKFGLTKNEKMREFAEQEMAHLKKEHFDYVSRWIKWILAEWKSENDRNNFQIKDLWLTTVDQRKERGTCVAQLYVENCFKNIITFSPKIEISTTTTTKNATEFRNGDICVISTEKQLAIGIAAITKIHEKSGKIELSFDKPLKIGSGPYYLDKYTSYSNFSTILGNLTYFMGNDEIGKMLRNTLVDLIPPEIPKIGELSQNVRKIIGKAKLNNEQRLAVINALVMENYLIVEGLPGSGKTTLISILIQCLIATGKTVLLAAFTHSAVDNILTKLTNDIEDDKILRLGNLSSIGENIRKVALMTKMQNVNNDYGEVKKILKNTPVVACTCHHVPRELLFSYRKFDFVIVDEASMVLEPLILPVLATSRKFVLVGDCKQLTPLVLSKKAKTEGAEISTMQKLQNSHPKIG